MEYFILLYFLLIVINIKTYTCETEIIMKSKISSFWIEYLSCPAEGTNNLYLITALFNVNNKRKELYKNFKNYINKFGVNLVTIEGVIGETEEFKVTNRHNNFDIQVRGEHLVWIKENLINIAVSRLPETWKYFVWIDSDLEFLEENWQYVILESFQKYEIIQPFKHIMTLGPDNNQILSHRFSFMYSYVEKLPIDPKYNNIYHSQQGFAFGFSRKAYYSLDKIFDYSIVGDGDTLLAYSLINKVDKVLVNGYHPNYLKKIFDYQIKVQKLAKFSLLGYSDLGLKHFFHGYYEDREYITRKYILINHKYDPEKDIYYNNDGLLQIKDHKNAMILDIKKHFEVRSEDKINITLENKYRNFKAPSLEEMKKRGLLLKKALE